MFGGVKDRFLQQVIQASHRPNFRLFQQNIAKEGPKAYTTERVLIDDHLFRFRTFFNEKKFRNVQKYTIAEAEKLRIIKFGLLHSKN